MYPVDAPCSDDVVYTAAPKWIFAELICPHMRHIQLAQGHREYYHLNVNKNTHCIINWILIFMVAMLPLRSVLAISHDTCKMHHEASAEITGHEMHAMHGESGDTRMDTDESMNCCHDSSVKCSSDCSMGMSVTVITPVAVTLPVLNETALRTHYISDLVVRDLAPPVRPPANLLI
jgi:hypothetical protein